MTVTSMGLGETATCPAAVAKVACERGRYARIAAFGMGLHGRCLPKVPDDESACR